MNKMTYRKAQEALIQNILDHGGTVYMRKDRTHKVKTDCNWFISCPAPDNENCSVFTVGLEGDESRCSNFYIPRESAYPSLVLLTGRYSILNLLNEEARKLANMIESVKDSAPWARSGKTFI